jgi:hypothetical protein
MESKLATLFVYGAPASIMGRNSYATPYRLRPCSVRQGFLCENQGLRDPVYPTMVRDRFFYFATSSGGSGGF